MPTDEYRQVLQNNRDWVARTMEEDPSFFETLAAGQSPDFLYIGCADSRVPANTIMGLRPGSVFVHRNVGNLVVNTDANAQAVIQYAVEHLHVRHVIVCGHYGCGAAHAATEHADHGLLHGWLGEIRDVYRFHQDELEALPDEEARHRRLIELNVWEQCANVIKTSALQRHYEEFGFPSVHGWVYDLSDGLIKDLAIPFEALREEVQRLHHVGPG
ncbi:MAG: carbonic anhydrase [Proteobacteria bacterium]|nr:carbonic anhydrase [Pseudomonadota bacterium]